MQLLNTLRLLVKSSAPSTGVAQGALYYDGTANAPKYYDGSAWQPFGGSTAGYPTFIQTTAPSAGQTTGLTKWVWVDTSSTPPTVNVETGSDVPTTTLTLSSPDDVQTMALMGAL